MQPLLLLSTGWVQFFEVFAALSILILLHEFGHFFFARLFKVRVEKFYLFFNPWFSLWKTKRGNTEYGVGWVPLGGYVKLAGMVDESMDTEAMAAPPKPDEFRTKPAWQRLFIMLGGIIVNILVAAIAYMIIFGTWGEDYLPTSAARYGISADSTARSIGLQNGDFITGIDGRPVERFNRIVPEIILEEGKTIQVQRGGQAMNIAIPTGTVRSIIKSQRATFIQPRFPAVVDDVAKGSAAEKMGLRTGDSIIATNGQPTPFFDQFEEMKKGLKGQPIQLTVVRKGAIAQLSSTLPQDGKLGFIPVGEPGRFFQIEKVRYSPIAAVGKGFSYAFEQFGSYGQQLKLLFTSKEVKLSESVGGLITFGKSAPQTFEWESFLRYLALISIILAFMNLLPIPGLDGGYVFFLLWEMITGRKVSDKVMERATTVGLVLLLGLMLYANGLDVFRLFKK